MFTVSLRTKISIAAALLAALRIPIAEAQAAAGTAYYVSSSLGDDAWPGTKDKPWKTLSKVSSMVFQPHDRILLKRGDVWQNQELVLQGSGNYLKGSWISVEASGEGAKPRITNPPLDKTPGLVSGWETVNKTYGTNRAFMKIAVKVDGGSGWRIKGLEIDNAEMGIFIKPDGAGFWLEDLYFHDIQGLFMPPIPDFQEKCEVECPMWDPYPQPAWGSAIEVNGDYVTIKDVVIENATGGVTGFANMGLIENVFMNKVKSGGLTIGGQSVTIRYATVLNAQWPDGAWFGADPVMSAWDTNFVVERSEIAYCRNHDSIGDASPINFDQETVNAAVRDNFFHDNDGSALEFNLVGENRRITIERNVCYNNGLEKDSRAGANYLKAAFSADACAYPLTSYVIKDNEIYKAFPGQRLNFYFALSPNGFADDFRYAQKNCRYTVSNNKVVEHEKIRLPLPVPAPPPISKKSIAKTAGVTASSGLDTARLAQDGSLDTEWLSNEAKPWIKYTWKDSQRIDTVRLFDRPDLQNWATSGVLTFSDGSRINVTGGILNNGAMREVVFDPPKTVTWMQFTVTRNAPETPGTTVGLSELQVYQDEAPPAPAEKVFPGAMTVDFSDRPGNALLLKGHYPDSANGIHWPHADWTTRKESRSGNEYVYVDFPRNASGRPATATRIFVLPWGKTLKSINVAGPEGAIVSISQAGLNPLVINCTPESKTYEMDLSGSVLSNIIGVWIDLNNAPEKNLNDVWFDDLVYGD